MIHLRGKILSPDATVEFTEFCKVSLDSHEVGAAVEWVGWITLPPGKAETLSHTGYLLSLQDGTQHNIILRERHATPASFDVIGAPF